MNPPAVIPPQLVQVASISDGANPSDDMAAALRVLIAQQPFLKGLNPRQLQLLADSALEMKFKLGRRSLRKEVRPIGFI